MLTRINSLCSKQKQLHFATFLQKLAFSPLHQAVRVRLLRGLVSAGANVRVHRRQHRHLWVPAWEIMSVWTCLQVPVSAGFGGRCRSLGHSEGHTWDPPFRVCVFADVCLCMPLWELHVWVNFSALRLCAGVSTSMGRGMSASLCKLFVCKHACARPGVSLPS